MSDWRTEDKRYILRAVRATGAHPIPYAQGTGQNMEFIQNLHECGLLSVALALANIALATALAKVYFRGAKLDDVLIESLPRQVQAFEKILAKLESLERDVEQVKRQ